MSGYTKRFFAALQKPGTGPEGDFSPMLPKQVYLPRFSLVFARISVIFQVVGNGRYVHNLVRPFQANGVDLAQAHELGEGTENGPYRALPLALHVAALPAFHPFLCFVRTRRDSTLPRTVSRSPFPNSPT